MSDTEEIYVMEATTSLQAQCRICGDIAQVPIKIVLKTTQQLSPILRSIIVNPDAVKDSSTHSH